MKSDNACTHVLVLKVKHEARVTKNQALCDVFDELSTCYFKVKKSQKKILIFF